MTRTARRVTSAGLIALSIGAGCRSSDRQAVEAAQSSSQVAVTPEQKRLWEDAAEKGDVPGLQRVPVPQDPVRDRERPVIQSKPVPPQRVTIPTDVVSQIRIVKYPNDPFATFKGTATVANADGDRIDLDLGPAGTLGLLARANKQPLPVSKTDVVDVFYQPRQVPEIPNDVISIRTKSGAGIAHVVKGDDEAVQLLVPLFDVTVIQLDKPGLPVNIIAPGFKDPTTFTMGVTTSVDNLMVRIVGSTRFTLNVLVWRNP